MRYLSILLLLSLSACVTSGDFNVLRNEVNELKRDSFSAKKDIDLLKEKTAVAVKEDSFSAVRESQADMNSRLSQVSMGLQELRGRFEENKYSLEKTMKDSASERDLLRAQITGLENQVKSLREKLNALELQSKPAEPAKDSSAEKPSPVPDEKAPVRPAEQGQPSEKISLDDRTKAYEAAYKAFKENRHKESREKFEAFIKNHPKNELTDNAQFWIAETYYAEKDYEGAILAYETVLKKYPDSEKTAGSLLKQGFAFLEIGDNKTGKIILDRLIEKFPDSREAEFARNKLSDIDKKPVRKK